MRKGLFINYTDVAAYLASESDKVQAEFFKVFAKELRATCDSHHRVELQMSSILALLSDEDIETMYFDKN